ncbi:MAG: hypothetical protein N4A36_03690, partial [Candidatus Gracilibacteria bacterium]|nr:hypothetical protein [Candidatus Gracilibacteria bacterium]
MPSANAASTWTAPEGEVEGGKFMNLLDSIMTNDDHPDIQWASDGSLTTSPSVNQSRGVVDQNDTKILNAKDGKIGVGTEDPSSELDVRGKIESMSLDTDVLSSDSVNTKHIDIESDVGVNAEMTIKSGSYIGNHWGIYQEQSDGSLKFWNGQNNAILDKNGKLGIGSMVTGPKAGLEIRSVYNNNSSSSQIGSILTLDAGSGITNEYARQIDFSVNGKTPARLGISGNASNLKDTSRFYINANPDELKSWESPDLMISSKTGHVGIGAEPDSYARLFVDGPTVTTDSFLRAKGENYNGTHYEREDSTGKKHRWSWYHMNNEHGRNTLQLWEYYDLNDNGRYCDGTDPVCSRMITISTGGNLGIGVSKPVEKLEVKGNIKANKIKSEEYCNDDSTDCKSIANIYSKTEADNRYYRKEEVDEKMSTVGGGKIVKISSNSNHNILLGSNGTVYAWGDNKYGQLGDGTRTDRKFPTKISGITNIVDIAAGYDHTFALKKDGTLWAWGSNSSGELGDGTKTSRKFPTKISGITNIVDIAAGYDHTFALKKDGTLWAWGSN